MSLLFYTSVTQTLAAKIAGHCMQRRRSSELIGRITFVTRATVTASAPRQPISS